jgi:uncharacterized protein YcfL
MRMQVAILALATVALVACTSQKEPAESAVAAVEASLNEIRADAQQYAAEDLKAADETMEKLKQNLAGKHYRVVIAEAKGMTTRVETLKSTVAEAKANVEATLAAAQAEWNDLSASVPAMVEKLQARIDQLSKTRQYPKGMDKAAFETAKSSFETLKTEWTEAGSEFTSGQAANAVRKARDTKAKAELLIATLEA